LKLSRPDTGTNKAVAFGAISYYLNRFVTGRLARYTYGAIACVDFDRSDPEHRRRSKKKKMGVAGEFILEAFSPILIKGTRVSDDTEEFSDTFAATSRLPPCMFGVRKLPITRYKGKREKPQWVDLEPEKYEIVCHVEVDPREIPHFTCISPMGPYFVQPYDVVYTHGQTEFKAQLRWEKEGEKKWSDAKILYDHVGE